MKKILQTRWVLLLIIFAVVGIITAAIFRLVTPAQPVIPKTDFISTNYSEGTTSFRNIRFTGSFQASITSLPLANVQASQTTFDYVRNQLIENYNLQQAVGISSLWRGEKYVLSYDPIGDTYIFYDANVPVPSRIETPDRGIDSAQQFIQANFPNLSLTPQRENIGYFSAQEELVEVTNRSQADIMEIPFSYSIENLPVYLGHEKTAPVVVLVDSLYEVRKVTFQPYFFTVTSTEQFMRLIDLGTALENIHTRNEAAVIAASEPETGVFSLEEIESGTLTKVQLEYRVDLNTGLAYPFYRFAGELINTEGKTIQAELITPAVETQ